MPTTQTGRLLSNSSKHNNKSVEEIMVLYHREQETS
jgi:hypothetical protein